MPARDFRKTKSSSTKTLQPPKKKQPQQSHPMTYLFSVVILAIIVVTFIGYPLMRNISAPGKLVFGYYNGQEIAYTPGNYFSQERDIIDQNLQSQHHNLSPQVLAYQVWSQAFQATAIHVAILQTAEQSGVHVTQHAIDKALTQSGPYIVNGKFSAQQYNQTSSSQKFQTRKFFRQELIDQQYRTDVIQNEKISKQAAAFMQAIASPERKFRYVAFPLDKFPESEVVAYGKANSKLFRSINVSRITIKSSANNAEAIYKKLIENPATFEEIAKNQSQDAYADKGGDMGWRNYYTLRTDFENQGQLDKLFTMKKGAITPVIRAAFGWTIYRVNDAARQPNLADKQTLKTIRSYMNEFELGKIQDYLVGLANKFRDKAVKDGFGAASTQDGMTMHATDYFPINFGDSFFLPQMKATDGNGALSNAAYKADFLQEIFGMKLDAISKPIILGNNVVLIQPLEQRPAPKRLESVIGTYYPQIVSQFVQADLMDQILSSNKLVNNFQQVFSKHFNLSSQTAQ